jgi:hypothetical protein
MHSVSFFLTIGTLIVSLLPLYGQGFSVIPLQDKWRRVDRVLPWPAPKVIWQGEPLIAPRGGLNLYGDMLFVSDPADRQNPDNKAARIVKFTVVAGVPTSPLIFFSRPGFLLSAKWSIPVAIDGQVKLIVADQGVELSDGTFSGIGAKVFLLPVLSDGTAGEPEVLWEGAPFICPTGIALVESQIYITDPCAGPEITRPDRPDYPFVSSAIFTLPIAGGQVPTVIQSGSPFTSLIGICPATPGELVVNDTDSGRLDLTNAGGRAHFAPPAGADRWILKILDPTTPVLSTPARTPFWEDGPVTLQLSNVPASATITLMSGPTNVILDPFHDNEPVESISFPASELNNDGTITFTVSSQVPSNYVCTFVLINGEMQRVDLFKDEDQSSMLVDNKHGGRVLGPRLASAAAARLNTSSDSSPSTIGYFTTDPAPDHAAIWIYPPAEHRSRSPKGHLWSGRLQGNSAGI